MAFGLNIGLDVVKKTSSTKFLQYRAVTLTSGNVVKHSTGVSTGAAAAFPFGIAQEQVSNTYPSTGTGYVAVRVIGESKVQASTGAIKVGARLKLTSGAVASTSFLGGTVKASTGSGAGYDIIGIALTSQAATATPGLISAFILPMGRA